ncbi:hypothetical protein O1L60_17645 [Streptomyces diastatochromogenes]|nr:hypothetical protein [Streptomyces diastatochromogenes]
MHVAASGGLSAANPVNAGHGEQAQGGTGTETGVVGGKSSTAPAGGVSPSPGEADGTSGKPQRPGADASGSSPRARWAPTPAPPAVRRRPARRHRAGRRRRRRRGQGPRHLPHRQRLRHALRRGRRGHRRRRGPRAADPARISVVRHTRATAADCPTPLRSPPRSS